ncbi:MAG: hypothetical protein J7J11_02115 [Desulfurococcales archaeon]|nr:hypothetical protein [Desulfurococcales archaeon]
MTKYTTVRVTVELKKRLDRISKLIGSDSLTATLKYILDIAEKELDKHEGDLSKVLASLTRAKDVGESNAEEVDRYLYGVGGGG